MEHIKQISYSLNWFFVSYLSKSLILSGLFKDPLFFAPQNGLPCCNLQMISPLYENYWVTTCQHVCILYILHWSSQLVRVVLILETHTILPSLKIQWGLKFLLSATNFINTCSFTIHFKKIDVCNLSSVCRVY